MIKYLTYLILSLSLLYSCTDQSEPQEAIQIDIDGAHEKIISELSRREIPHKLDEHNRIWYPSSYREEIDIISSKVTAELSPVTMALFPETEILNEVIKKFEVSNIPYTLERSELGMFIKWDDKDAIKGTTITKEFTYIINNAL